MIQFLPPHILGRVRHLAGERECLPVLYSSCWRLSPHAKYPFAVYAGAARHGTIYSLLN